MENNKNITEILIECEIKKIVEQLYLVYGTDSDLFGIPHQYKDGVESIVKAFYDFYLQMILND